MGIEFFLSDFYVAPGKLSRLQQFNYKGISFIVFLLAGVRSVSSRGLLKLKAALQFL